MGIGNAWHAPAQVLAEVVLSRPRLFVDKHHCSLVLLNIPSQQLRIGVVVRKILRGDSQVVLSVWSYGVNGFRFNDAAKLRVFSPKEAIDHGHFRWEHNPVRAAVLDLAGDSETLADCIQIRLKEPWRRCLDAPQHEEWLRLKVARLITVEMVRDHKSSPRIPAWMKRKLSSQSAAMLVCTYTQINVGVREAVAILRQSRIPMRRISPRVAEPVAISIDPESELDGAMAQRTGSVPVQRGGETCQATRVGSEPRGAYDPEMVLERLNEVADSISDEEADRLLELVYRDR
ncbi:MAG: hypothetical protein QM692_21880 [Thermomicrobiales bacterium]